MIKASIVVPEAYIGNRLFDFSNKRLNRDDCLYGFRLLKDRLASNGIDLATQDLNRPEESALVICNDMPRPRLPPLISAKKILLLFETEVIRADNWDFSNHKDFDVIFTWRDDLAGRGKYRKFNFSSKIPTGALDTAKRSRKKFCTMIAGNKRSLHPFELYSERLRAIKWFESEHPADFDLYGIGWDQNCFSGLLQPLNRSPLLRKVFASRRPSYRGSVVSKLDTLANYRYAICYENVKDMPGYITEKIFDCLFAGCVPVYLGAPNIDEYVPSDCFIDRKAFGDYSALYAFLAGMGEPERKRYVEAAMDFVHGPRMEAFGPERFATDIAAAAVDILNEKGL